MQIRGLQAIEKLILIILTLWRDENKREGIPFKFLLAEAALGKRQLYRVLHKLSRNGYIEKDYRRVTEGTASVIHYSIVSHMSFEVSQTTLLSSDDQRPSVMRDTQDISQVSPKTYANKPLPPSKPCSVTEDTQVSPMIPISTAQSLTSVTQDTPITPNPAFPFVPKPTPVSPMTQPQTPMPVRDVTKDTVVSQMTQPTDVTQDTSVTDDAWRDHPVYRRYDNPYKINQKSDENEKKTRVFEEKRADSSLGVDKTSVILKEEKENNIYNIYNNINTKREDKRREDLNIKDNYNNIGGEEEEKEITLRHVDQKISTLSYCSSQNSSCQEKNNLPAIYTKINEKMVKKLFLSFKNLYPNRFKNENQSVTVWLAVLEGANYEQIKTAVHACPQEHPSWPPTPGEFYKLVFPKGSPKEVIEEIDSRYKQISVLQIALEKFKETEEPTDPLAKLDRWTKLGEIESNINILNSQIDILLKKPKEKVDENRQQWQKASNPGFGAYKIQKQYQTSRQILEASKELKMALNGV